MAEKNRVRKFDTDLCSFLLFLLIYCIIAVVFSLKDGSDVMFYAGFPMLFSAVCAVFSMICADGFTREQTARRLARKKYGDALTLFGSVLRFSFVCAAGTFVIFYLGSGILGKAVLGNALFAPILRAFTPALVLLPFLGAMKGFLHGIGKRRAARVALWLLTVFYAMFGPVFGLIGAHRGSKVAAILRNDDMMAVYCACGIGTGLSAAAMICFVFLVALTFLSVRSLQRSSHYRREDLFEGRRSESSGELFHYCAMKLLPGFILGILMLLALVIGYRMWLGSRSLRPAIVKSVWGGFTGVGLPICLGTSLLLAMPFTQLTVSCVRACQQEKRKLLRMRLLLLLRLSAYMGIPASAFVFAAAKEIAGMFTQLTFKGEESAVLTLKAGSFLIFLVQTAILLLIFFWRCEEKRVIVFSAGAAFFAEIVFLVVLKISGVGITMNVWPLDVMGVVFLVILYLAGRSGAADGVDPSFLTEDILIAVCAAGAAIPLLLLNDYMLAILPAPLAFLVMLAVFWILFVLLSLFLHAADLRNLHRIPGGGWILNLAMVLGVMERED